MRIVEELGLKEPEFEFNDKVSFINATSKCVEYLNWTTDKDMRVPIGIIIAMAGIESAWGKSRFAVEGYNYFVGYGWKDSSNKHNIQLIITGAPQTHNQRTSSFYNMAKVGDYQKYGIRYNYNHGFLNGNVFNQRKNFYHKPLASVNWEYDINSSTNLSASLYYSV